jgi:hypothetical protein
MICRSDGAYRNLFCGNYKDLAPTEHALALEMSKLQTDAQRLFKMLFSLQQACGCIWRVGFAG